MCIFIHENVNVIVIRLKTANYVEGETQHVHFIIIKLSLCPYRTEQKLCMHIKLNWRSRYVEYDVHPKILIDELQN